MVVISGPTDYVTDGEVTAAVAGGHASVQRVTGTGCALSALMAAFAAVAKAEGADGLGALGYATACCAFYKACAAVAAADGAGPGTFKPRLLDALAMPEPQLVAAAAAAVSFASVPTPPPAQRAEPAP